MNHKLKAGVPKHVKIKALITKQNRSTWHLPTEKGRKMYQMIVPKENLFKKYVKSSVSSFCKRLDWLRNMPITAQTAPNPLQQTD